MRVACSTLALTGAFLAVAVTAPAQTALTLAEALARARGQAQQIVSARLAIDESRGQLSGATHFPLNPELDFGLGNRHGNGSRSMDIDLGYGQMFEPGRRQGARRAMAAAGIDQRLAELEEVTRVTLRDTAAAFLRVVFLSDRIRLLERTSDLADRVLEIADRRFRAGDIAILDVNIARAARARAIAERQGTEADRALAIGRLQQLLQLEGDVDVRGDLASAGDPRLDVLMTVASDLPELRALNAAIREAEAEGQYGQSFRRPGYGVTARYQREDGDQILQGGLTFTLPVFSKGQEPIAVGAARATRLRAELTAALVRVRLDVRSAFEAHQGRSAAVRSLERDALPGLDENDGLATRSFEVGQLGLVELLLIRREILDTRFQYLDALWEAALARVEVDARAGVLR